VLPSMWVRRTNSSHSWGPEWPLLVVGYWSFAVKGFSAVWDNMYIFPSSSTEKLLIIVYLLTSIFEALKNILFSSFSIDRILALFDDCV
jgi:hypothetical protein